MKAKTILCDIDGTIAHRVNRDPYEWYKVSGDTPDKMLHTLLWSLNRDNYSIIYISGRDRECLYLTREWLERYAFPQGYIYMREMGDGRESIYVKQDLYKEYIEPFHDVQLVFEDSFYCTEMWRELGLTCYQVAKGDF